ncbi:unnamed protein product [Leptidea sinapis]|nr:unnamed protein product [Leptidea sinapis]
MKKQRRVQMAQEMREAAAGGGPEEQQLANEMADAFLSDILPENVFSSPKAGAGMWASQIRVVDMGISGGQPSTLFKLPLEQNEAAVSLCLIRWAAHGEHGVTHLVVGVAKDMILSPRSCTEGSLHVYKVYNIGKLELVHKTPVDEYPGALAAFNGRLVAGVGRMLRLYDIGRRKLLRKCENRHIPNLIIDIKATRQRIFVSDVQESVFCVKYKRRENQLIIFADDTNPRWITNTCILDYDSIAMSDKFGNIAIMRLPQSVTDDVDEDPTGNKALWDRGLLNGASQKGDVVVNFHVGETVTSLQRATLIPGGSEALLYATISGSLGVLLPFTSREDHDFFQHLEMHMRSENSPICGRDHLSFRSYYYPVKNVIDGDLCEQFNSLEPAKQKAIAGDLERTPAEVSKKLEDIRTRYAF